MQQGNEGLLGGGDPFVLVPDRVRGDIHAWSRPGETDELLACQFLGDDDFRQETNAHAQRDAVFDGLHSGKLRDIAGANIHERKKLIEFLAIGTTGFGEKQSLATQILGLYFFGRGERMSAVREKENFFRAQAH